jgi:hypothetical protein
MHLYGVLFGGEVVGAEIRCERVARRQLEASRLPATGACEGAVSTRRSVASAKLYDCKTPLTVARLMNDRVVPSFHQHQAAVIP